MIYLISHGEIHNLSKHILVNLEDLKKDKNPVCIVSDNNMQLEAISDSELKNLKDSPDFLSLPKNFAIESIEKEYANILSFAGKRIYGFNETFEDIYNQLKDINNIIFIPLEFYAYAYSSDIVLKNNISETLQVLQFDSIVYFIFYSSFGNILSSYLRLEDDSDTEDKVLQEFNTFIQVNIEPDIFNSKSFGIIINNKKVYNKFKKSLKYNLFLNEYNQKYFNLKTVDYLKYIDLDILLLRLAKTNISKHLKVASILFVIAIGLLATTFFISKENNKILNEIKRIETETKNYAEINQSLIYKNNYLFLKTFVNTPLNELIKILIANHIFDITGYKLFGYEYSNYRIKVFYFRQPVYSAYIETDFIEKMKALLSEYKIIKNIRAEVVVVDNNRMVEFNIQVTPDIKTGV